jgi:hypothetical protein
VKACLPDNVARRDALPMIGRTFGDLKVLAFAGRHDFGVSPATGWRVRVRKYRVRCKCGSEFDVVGGRLRSGVTQRCVACGRKASRTKAKAKSVRLPDGRTLAQIADATGLRLDTVYHRYIRGWPHWRLAETPQARPAERSQVAA